MAFGTASGSGSISTTSASPDSVSPESAGIFNALAAADKTVHLSLVAARVNQAISVAVQRVVAFNILEDRYTSLPKGRVAAHAQAEPGGAD